MVRTVKRTAYRENLGTKNWPGSFMNCLRTSTFTSLISLYPPGSRETRPRSRSLSRWYRARVGLEKFKALCASRTPTVWLDAFITNQYTLNVLPLSSLAILSALTSVEPVDMDYRTRFWLWIERGS